MRYLTRLVSGLVVVMLTGIASAAPMTITWQDESPTTDTGNPNNFSDGEITFPGFTADTLTGFSSTGIMHNHSSDPNNQLIELEIELDGAWTTIFSRNLENSEGDVPVFDGLSPPITFPQGLVTGIGMTSDPFSGQTFHLTSASGAETTFTFDTLQSVPEPAGIAIWSMMLAAVVGGSLLARRRSAVKAALNP